MESAESSSYSRMGGPILALLSLLLICNAMFTNVWSVSVEYHTDESFYVGGTVGFFDCETPHQLDTTDRIPYTCEHDYRPKIPSGGLNKEPLGWDLNRFGWAGTTVLFCMFLALVVQSVCCVTAIAISYVDEESGRIKMINSDASIVSSICLVVVVFLYPTFVAAYYDDIIQGYQMLVVDKKDNLPTYYIVRMGAGYYKAVAAAIPTVIYTLVSMCIIDDEEELVVDCTQGSGETAKKGSKEEARDGAGPGADGIVCTTPQVDDKVQPKTSYTSVPPTKTVSDKSKKKKPVPSSKRKQGEAAKGTAGSGEKTTPSVEQSKETPEKTNKKKEEKAEKKETKKKEEPTAPTPKTDKKTKTSDVDPTAPTPKEKTKEAEKTVGSTKKKVESQPKSVQPKSVQPEPKSVQPKSVQPKSVQPKSVQPKSTQPAATAESKSSDQKVDRKVEQKTSNELTKTTAKSAFCV